MCESGEHPTNRGVFLFIPIALIFCNKVLDIITLCYILIYRTLTIWLATLTNESRKT